MKPATDPFSPDCLPILIGSLPHQNHAEAIDLILEYTPRIPLWPQLPKLQREGMVRQFVSGFPGLVDRNSGCFVDTSKDDFPTRMTEFYEHFLVCREVDTLPDDSLFGLGSDTARGFFTFMQRIASLSVLPLSLKGQVTGPVTTGIGIRDQNGLPLIHDDNLRDMLIKLLAGKARWQVERLKPWCGGAAPVIFIDEPGMVNFGSTAFSGISGELAAAAVSALIESIHRAGGLGGIHICANGDWGPALSSTADIISFDAYSYFDNFILYREQLTSFLEKGGILAWGIVPTADPGIVSAEQVETLLPKWSEQLDRLCSLGFDRSRILQQTLIAPACGTGSLSREQAEKVLFMTRTLSDRIRSDYSL